MINIVLTFFVFLKYVYFTEFIFQMLSFKLSINHVLAATDCRLLCTIIDRLWKKDWQCQVLKFINSF